MTFRDCCIANVLVDPPDVISDHSLVSAICARSNAQCRRHVALFGAGAESICCRFVPRSVTVHSPTRRRPPVRRNCSTSTTQHCDVLPTSLRRHTWSDHDVGRCLRGSTPSAGRFVATVVDSNGDIDAPTASMIEQHGRKRCGESTPTSGRRRMNTGRIG